MNFLQLFTITKETTNNVNILIDITTQNGVPKLRKLVLTHLEISHIKDLCFYFEKLKTELKDLVSIKSCGSLNVVDFKFWLKKCGLQQNYGNLATNWYIFSKVLMVPYHCSKFHVSCRSLFRVTGRMQE